MIRAAVWIFWKDITLEFRGRELLLPAGVFGLLIAMLYGFAFDPTRNGLHGMFPGLLWLGIFFASFLAVGRAFSVEAEASGQLLLAPIDRGAVFLAKLGLNVLLTLVLAAVMTPAFSILLQVSLPQDTGGFLLVEALGLVGFAAAGTAMGALSAQTRLRELLLPALLLPFTSPLLLGVVSATEGLYGQQAASSSNWVLLIAIFDVIYIIVPVLLFEFLTEV
ncbi:MAG: heme exporter protein CcmB [Thermaerobacter sp.]|nr:heme exporter protein CcmB [Thermaerobacter sp.]